MAGDGGGEKWGVMVARVQIFDYDTNPLKRTVALIAHL